jgi:hypothetical protein
MRSRREFLQIGATATAWPLVAGSVQAAGLVPDARFAPLSAVVYDTRFPESVRFAERLSTQGVQTLAIEADMTRLWYDHIYHQWKRGVAPIAGLTAHGPMFCFAELARDVRMRVVFRAEHHLRGAQAAHALTGPQPMVTDALIACGRQPEFGAAMAGIVTRCPIGRSEIADANIGTLSSEPDEDALYTWLIAPATRG